MLVVILGTAHGLNVAGKCSPDGTFKEYQWSREMCRRIKERLLKIGIDSYIDIEEDIEESLSDRIFRVNSICNSIYKDSLDIECIYISIHVNAASNCNWSNASGCTVYVSNNCSKDSKKLALAYYETAKEMNLLGNRCIPKTKYYVGNLAVCRDTICPAILTENEYMDNNESVEWLKSEEGKQKIEDLHIETILKYIESEFSYSIL